MGLDMFLYGEYEVPAYECGKTHSDLMDAYRREPTKGKRLEKIRQACGLPTNLPVECEDFTWIDIRFPLAKWRKANSIHKWFIDNCAPKDHKGKPIDDCKPIHIPDIKLKELDTLLDHLLKTKGLIDNPTAKKVLPTTAGCFFGSTEYDEWYWENLEYTSKRIKAVLNYQETQNKKDNKNKQSVGKMFDAIYYRASW